MSDRFYESPPWRFVVTRLDSTVLTFLDKLASSRSVTRTLNAALVVEGAVPSDHPEISIVTGDGTPFLHEGNRLLYAMRREDAGGSGDPIWVCRAGTIILEVDDHGEVDVPSTGFRAYDPWQLLYKRPIVTGAGALPGENGISYLGVEGSAAALEMLINTDTHHGPTHIDLFSGTVEVTEDVEIDFQQGTSVGEAWDMLVETGTLDIVLEPVYDPIARPGIVAELNIYNRAGSVRYEAMFAWDKPSRSVIDLTRSRDGKERANKIQYYVGQGGPPVPLETDPASVSDYGQYWEQQFFPSHESALTVSRIADGQRRLRKNGKVAYTMSPAPERSPIPFVDYDIGDTVPIYGSSRMREAVAAMKRVHAIPLTIGDDQMEAPASILVVDDEELGSQ